MPIVADASVAIRGDITGFQRDLRSAEGATQTFGQRIRTILSPRNIIGAAGIFGIGLGLQQIVRGVGDVIDDFSQLKQATKTVDEVFGDSAEVIEDWADRAADAAGMSRQEVATSAATMGQMLTNMGLEAETAADMVVTLQQRAADLATAFPNAGDSADAMLAFSAALRGERDTVEKFGVTLTQAMIDARIETENLDTSTPAAERYATAIATLGLIMDQTADSAGRFEEALDEGDPKAMAERWGARWDNALTGFAMNLEQTVQQTGDDLSGIVEFFDDQFNPEKQANLQRLADLTGVTFSQMRDDVQAAADAAGVSWADQLAFMITATEKTASEMEPSSRRIPRAAAEGIEAGEAEVRAAAQFGITDPVFEEMLLAEENAGKSAQQVVIEYAKGLLVPQNEVEIAIQAALQIVEDEMSITEELAYLSGQKTVLEEARGIASQEGKDASVIAIDAALSVIEERMAELANDAYDYGFNTSAEFAAGMLAGKGIVVDAGRQVSQAAGAPITINSEPPDHSSGLFGITKWGGNIVKTLAEGMVGELGTASAASAALAGALSPAFGAGLPGAGGMVGEGATTINYNLIVEGQAKTIGSRDDVIDAWTQMTKFNDRNSR